MNKAANFFLLLFAFSLGANIIGNYFNLELLNYITKPIILLSLIGFYIKKINQINYTFLLALVFSWLGDVVLLFQASNNLFFILGLVCFLIAHIFYTIYFSGFIKKVRFNYFFVLAILLYLLSFLWLLFPFLQALKIPVFVYAIVISTMLLIILHTNFTGKQYKLAVLGATLFVISDSILAINKFYAPFALAGVFIMLTYGLAQYFLVKSATS